MTQPTEPQEDEYRRIAAGFVKELRKRRLELGISQAKVAEYMEVASSTVAYWEGGGTIPFFQFLRLAEALRFEFSMQPYITDVAHWIKTIEPSERVYAAGRREAEREAGDER